MSLRSSTLRAGSPGCTRCSATRWPRSPSDGHADEPEHRIGGIVGRPVVHRRRDVELARRRPRSARAAPIVEWQYCAQPPRIGSTSAVQVGRGAGAKGSPSSAPTRTVPMTSAACTRSSSDTSPTTTSSYCGARRHQRARRHHNLSADEVDGDVEVEVDAARVQRQRAVADRVGIGIAVELHDEALVARHRAVGARRARGGDGDRKARPAPGCT